MSHWGLKPWPQLPEAAPVHTWRVSSCVLPSGKVAVTTIWYVCVRSNMVLVSERTTSPAAEVGPPIMVETVVQVPSGFFI